MLKQSRLQAGVRDTVHLSRRTWCQTTTCGNFVYWSCLCYIGVMVLAESDDGLVVSNSVVSRRYMQLSSYDMSFM